MWEAIRSNRRRSTVLIALLGAVLVGLGFAIGFAVEPAGGGAIGAVVALVVWLGLWLVAWTSGNALLLQGAGARKVEKADAPRLHNIVEEMTIASGLPRMPKVYVIDNDSPNAFAVGRKPETAAVAVTTGLLKRLNRDELQGVVAHEIGHVRNLDIRFMTLASVTLGSVVLISHMFLASLWYGGRYSRGRRGGGQGQIVVLAVVLVAAVLAPILARLLYFACSRRREYLADASAARFTRYPEGLASALEKISQAGARAGRRRRDVNPAMAPLYIVNPLQAFSSAGLFSTHPPAEERIRILRAMGGMAGYRAYESAFRAVRGKGGGVSASAIREDDNPPVREASKEQDTPDETARRAREATDALGRLAGYAFLPCACGLMLRVPPEARLGSLSCPRCGRAHEVERPQRAGRKGGAPRGT